MMGITELIPGVSSGTIAILLGIYDQLISAINGLFSKEWKKHVAFLLPLGIGMLIALFSLSRLMKWLLENHFEPTQFFFLGLIVGILPLLFRRAKVKTTFNIGHFLLIAMSAIGVASMRFFADSGEKVIIETLTMNNGFVLFASGWLASMAMLLPGISGSFVLLILGSYYTAIGALSDFNIPIIAVIGSGVIIGFIVCSRLIKFLLNNFPYMTYAIIIGLVLGSTVVVYPGISSSIVIFPCVITFIAGAVTAVLLGAKDNADI
ncbi:DUF368 domain-containing protein [Bacillus tamaricis]|uniref:DUF368 domain-containing protein n=2 Tax=Evansella tamaricis TaxID=2069301 RepID=A0ABS6JFX9_9BACI|nr:DUF368 domain-containing protein [Evansella tamaricis]MBU9712511.1 DUF368 domain-containing protein [Evansella tamaricis]